MKASIRTRKYRNAHWFVVEENCPDESRAVFQTPEGTTNLAMYQSVRTRIWRVWHVLYRGVRLVFSWECSCVVNTKVEDSTSPWLTSKFFFEKFPVPTIINECNSVEPLKLVNSFVVWLWVEHFQWESFNSVGVVPVRVRVCSVVAVGYKFYLEKQCVSKPIKLISPIIVSNLVFTSPVWLQICPGHWYDQPSLHCLTYQSTKGSCEVKLKLR